MLYVDVYVRVSKGFVFCLRRMLIVTGEGGLFDQVGGMQCLKQYSKHDWVRTVIVEHQYREWNI